MLSYFALLGDEARRPDVPLAFISLRSAAIACQGGGLFELTRDFLAQSPFVRPNINILTPYGGTPIHERLLAENRVLASLPHALYCSPYLAFVLRSYETLEFYDRLINLLDASTSFAMPMSGARQPGTPLIKSARLAQTIAIKRDIREMLAIRQELRCDATLRAFHAGRTNALSAFYRNHLNRLGRFAELLSSADLLPANREPGALPRPNRAKTDASIHSGTGRRPQ